MSSSQNGSRNNAISRTDISFRREIQPLPRALRNQLLYSRSSRKSIAYRKMEEAFDWVSDNQGTVALTWVAVVFATAVLWFTTKGDSEAAVNFEVPLPKQCEPDWQGEVLQEPGLKVCFAFPSCSILSFPGFSFLLWNHEFLECSLMDMWEDKRVGYQEASGSCLFL